MSPAPHPRMHGITHVPGGPDPIPGLDWLRLGGGVIYADYVLSLSNLIGYWRLGETGSPWADTSGAGPNDMTIDGSGLALTADVTGGLPAAQDDGGVQFNYDGTSSTGGTFLETGAPTPSNFFQINPLTVAAFVKLQTVAGTRRGAIVASQTWSGSNYLLGWALQAIYPSGHVRFGLGQPTGFGGAEQYAESPGPLVADTWYHVAGTYDGAEIKLYLNGTLVATTAYADASNIGTTSGVTIGYQIGTSVAHWWLTGSVDEAAVWDAALTATQIATLASATAEGAEEGQVPVVDDDGDIVLGFPTVKVDGTRYDEILTGTNLDSTDNLDGTVTLDASGGGGDPADDTAIWMPLTTVTAGVPDLVWDGDDQLIPTLTPL